MIYNIYKGAKSTLISTATKKATKKPSQQRCWGFSPLYFWQKVNPPGNTVYHCFFRQPWLVIRVKLMEINSNLSSRPLKKCRFLLTILMTGYLKERKRMAESEQALRARKWWNEEFLVVESLQWYAWKHMSNAIAQNFSGYMGITLCGDDNEAL